MPLSTVSGILKRIGMGRLGRLGLEPAVRYERERPGELIHIDVKKLGRIQGGAGKRVTGGRATTTAGAHRRRRHTPRARPAGNTFTSPSTTPPAWPTPKSCQTRKPRPRSAFLRRADRVLRPPRHHRRELSSPTTARPTSRPSTRSPAAPSASGTCAPAPTAPRPTAKQNASSAPCSAAGPTARSTAQAANAPQPLTAGSGTTTITDDTQPSADKHPSPA